MSFTVAVIYFSLRGRLVTLANVIAAGARQVPGADVSVYRIQDPVRGDNLPPAELDDGVLEAPVVSLEDVLAADALILGAPGRQGGMCGEMRLFLDSLAQFQRKDSLTGTLKGKVGSAFTSVGGSGRGYGGHEAILASFHATFLQHGMVVVGAPPSSDMEEVLMGTPFGVVMAGKETADRKPALTEAEVKLAYNFGLWTAQVTRALHGSGN